MIALICFDLNADNLDPELNGMTEALRTLNLKNGKIVTVTQHNQLEKEGFQIEAVPCHQFLLS